MNTSASDKPLRVGNRTISRRRLAGRVGVTPGHIGMIFSGLRNPSLKLASSIAEELGISIDQLWEVLNHAK